MPVLGEAALAVVLLPSVAQAYIDPGYGALLWQALVAGGLGVAYKVYGFWRRLRARRKPEQGTEPLHE